MSIPALLVRGIGETAQMGPRHRTETTAMSATSSTRDELCDPTTAVTRSLLGYGVIAGPLYVGVSLAQALTRDGFDLTRHAWSLLANGSLGWIQIANFMLFGAMTIAFAVGLRRALPRQRWAPRLIGVYGGSLIAAGVFRADPALGFPVGTPDDAREVSWHGLAHFALGGVGFLCLIVACLLLARGFAADGQRRLGPVHAGHGHRVPGRIRRDRVRRRQCGNHARFRRRRHADVRLDVGLSRYTCTGSRARARTAPPVPVNKGTSTAKDVNKGNFLPSKGDSHALHRSAQECSAAGTAATRTDGRDHGARRGGDEGRARCSTRPDSRRA